MSIKLLCRCSAGCGRAHPRQAVLRALAPLPPWRLRAPPNPLRRCRGPNRKSILMGGRGAFWGIGASAERRYQRLRARGLLRFGPSPRSVRFLSGFRCCWRVVRSSVGRRLARLRGPGGRCRFSPLRGRAARLPAPSSGAVLRASCGASSRSVARITVATPRLSAPVPGLGLRASSAAVGLGGRRCGGGFCPRFLGLRGCGRSPPPPRAFSSAPALSGSGSASIKGLRGLGCGLRAASALPGFASLPPRA